MHWFSFWSGVGFATCGWVLLACLATYLCARAAGNMLPHERDEERWN